MRIQPRQQILDIWKSVVRASYQDGAWIWGGRDEPNSISDAEQLLCLLYPATELVNLAVESPDEAAEDVLAALDQLGGPTSIPQRLIEALAEFLDRYTDEQGEPIFAAGSYLRVESFGDWPDAAGPRQVTDAQRAIEVVDSYSVSVTLCLAAIGFVKRFKQMVRRAELLEKIEQVESSLEYRLTCAMIGLLRSFVVHTVAPTDPAYGVMMEMLNQGQSSNEAVLEQLETQLIRVRARLRDSVRIGVDIDGVRLDDRDRLFECGWGWGIARNATPVEIAADGVHRMPRIADAQGIADDRPYLYSTVVALRGIDELRSTRTRLLGLLTDEQSRLAEALLLRWDMTQRYWSVVARLGEEKWPLEDIPWRTSDGDESDYYSLLVSVLLLQDMDNRDASDADLNRLVPIFESLAERGRISRRVTHNDSAVGMHSPGVRLFLDGTEALGPQLYWNAADFSPLLLKCAVQAARLSTDVSTRHQFMRLAEVTMDHLERRRINYGTAAGLWDDPGELLFPYDDRKPLQEPSWFITARVVEALVAAARTFSEPPLRNTTLTRRALELLVEADHLLDQQMLDPVDRDKRVVLARIETKLANAKRIMNNRPGTAFVLTSEALRMLDELDAPAEVRQAGGEEVPVSIYLESDASADSVEHSVLDVLSAFGFVLDEAQDPVYGSWFRTMTARLKGRVGSQDVLARIERALEMQALHKPQAEIDSAQADAVAKLITALSQDPNAFVQIGSVFLIKVDGVIVVRNLSQRELDFLQRNSGMLAAPQKILEALEEFATNGDRPVQPPSTGPHTTRSLPPSMGI